jgi:outer membrane protein assembly factor BamB
MGSWCTPVVAKVDGKDQVLVSQPTRLVAYDPADGKILWWAGGISHDNGDLAYSSPTVVGDMVVAVGGFMGPMMGVKLDGNRGDVTSTHRLWRFEKRPQSIGSGIPVDGRLYLPQAGPARIDCIDPRTGKAAWEHRVDGTAFWSSLVQAGGRLYATTQRGTTVVLVPNPDKAEILALNDLKEACNATPAISDGDVFIRTHRHLWCIAGGR